MKPATPATPPACPSCGQPTELDPLRLRPLLCLTCDAIHRH